MADFRKYFVRHPEAFADVEGVARWRLIEDDVRFRLEETQRALDALVERGLLELMTPAGTAPLYRLNLANQHEAERLSRDPPRRMSARTGRRKRPVGDQSV
jgi:hypothetical protein